MHIKTYEAPSMQEALHNIKAELGKDAIIVSSRSIDKMSGSHRKAGEKWIEVTAAIERNGKEIVPERSRRHFPESGVFYDGKRKKEKKYDILPEGFDLFSHDSEVLPDAAVPSCEPCYRQLLSSGFNKDFAWFLLGEANDEYRRNTALNSIDDILLRNIGRRLPIEGSISVHPNRKKIVALIGPTGVGKTTTIAKIAAHCARVPNIKIRLVTMDTYRIAAAEQLKIYGKIMGLPVVVAATRDDLEKEIAGGDDFNLTLIDTAGRNYRKEEQVDELAIWLNKYKEIESHLLLSATTSENVLRGTIKCFKKTRIDRIIMTKTDESIYLGHLYKLLVSTRIPISYITTGQRVPEDIRAASAQSLSKIFLKGFDN